MTALNSSVVFWNESEIIPDSILLIASGAGGDRLLFWHPISANRSGITKTSSTDNDPPKCGSIKCGPAVMRNSRKPVSEGNSLASSNHPNVAQRKCTGHAGISHFVESTNSSSHTTNSCSALYHSTSVSQTQHNMLSIGSPTISGAAQSQLLSSVVDLNTPDCSIGVGRNTVHSCPTSAAEMVVEGISVSSLLSLLHISTHEMQSKIYVKFGNKVFVGVTFSTNIEKIGSFGVGVQDEEEADKVSDAQTNSPSIVSLMDFMDLKSHSGGNRPPPHCRLTPQCVVDTHSTGGRFQQQNVITSFAVVFTLNDGVAPCVFSHYTELARLTGIQIRRAEMFWQYLSKEREKIVSILDSHSGISSFVKDSSVDEMMETASALDDENSVDLNQTDCRQTIALQIFAVIAKMSPLCGELQRIVELVTSTGRVNIAIYNRYPVFFCLPFKAYSIMPKSQLCQIPIFCWPAIRPRAVWKAMEGLRPYHTLLLTTRKHELLTNCLPNDANKSLTEFIKGISPTINLGAMSVRMHSQEHCLRLAVWLIYHGHAIIIFPIVRNNVYALSPLAEMWIQPQIILQFSARFPHLNFAEILESFSQNRTLNEHFCQSNGTDSDFTSDLLWKDLNLSETVNLICWLLRRRIIIQQHTYVLSLLQTSACSAGKNDPVDLFDSTLNVTSPNKSFPTTSWKIDDIDCFVTESDMNTINAIISILPHCSEEMIITWLPDNLSRERVLKHYATINDPTMLHLFLRLLVRLPAHLEELMFVEGVDRETLISCVEHFSPFLTTFCLPDSVTACFAGVEWPN